MPTTVRLARLEGGATGLVVGDDSASARVVEVAASVEGLRRHHASDADVVAEAFSSPSVAWEALIAEWATVGPALERMGTAASAEGNGPGWRSRPLAGASLEAPLPSAAVRIYAAGANFVKHSVRAFAALGKPATEREVMSQKTEQGLPPWGFLVFADAVMGDRASVTPPRGTQKLDYEAEIAAVIGKGGRYLKPSDVKFCGAAAWNDFSIRDPHFGLGPAVDRGPLTWALQKNFETGSACGPWLAVGDSFDPAQIGFECRVNGTVRQRSSTAEMMYSFEEIASHLSHYVTLRPGDIVVSGTPEGTAVEGGLDGPFLGDGDTVEVAADGLGILHNTVELG